MATAVQHQGKHLSFNNLADLDGALRAVFEYTEPACAIIKHMNPCGVAIAPELVDAFIKARTSDPVSIFGGIVAVNRILDKATAEAMQDRRSAHVRRKKFMLDAIR